MWIWLFAQVAQDTGFWPSKLNDWMLFVVVYVFGILAAVAGFWHWLMKPLNEKIAAETEQRIHADRSRDKLQRKVSDKVHNVLGRLTQVEQNHELAEKDRAYMHETIGRIDEAVTTLSASQLETNRQQARELSEIRAGVARIMGKLGIDE
jgi:hypothetical protein